MRPKSGHGRLEMIRHIFCKYYLGGKWRMDWKWKWKSLSHVQLFVTPWTRPWNYTGQNVGVGSLSLLQGIFPTQRPNPGLPHCRLILVFFFFFAGWFFTSWATGEAQAYWNGKPIPSPKDLPDPGIKSGSPELQQILYQLNYQKNGLEWMKLSGKQEI